MAEKTNVPEIRFAGFTDPWEQRKLGEIAPVTMGQSPNGACYTDNPNDVVLVQGNADLKDGWVSPRVWTTEITKTAKSGDLIMSVRAPVGAMGKTAYDVVLGRGVAGIVGNEFLFQALSKKEAEGYWSTVSAGSTFDSINGDELRSTPIDCPRSETECEAIGNCLSKVDYLITLHQRKYDKLCAVKKSMLDKMFPKPGEIEPEIRFAGFTDPWEQRKLGDVATRHDNLRIPITAKDRIPGDTPYYGANGIQDYVEGYTHEGEFVLVAEDGATDLDNYPVQLISGLSWVNNHAHVIKAIPDLAQNRFIMHLIKSMDIASYLVGGTRSKLNAEVLMGIELKLPSNSEQIYIGTLLSTLDSLITLHQRELNLLKNTKKSLLDKMFV